MTCGTRTHNPTRLRRRVALHGPSRARRPEGRLLPHPFGRPKPPAPTGARHRLQQLVVWSARSSHLRGLVGSRGHLPLRSAPFPRRLFRACSAPAAPKRDGGACTFEALLRRRVRSASAPSLAPRPPVLPWALIPFEMFPTRDVPASSRWLLRRGGGAPPTRRCSERARAGTLAGRPRSPRCCASPSRGDICGPRPTIRITSRLSGHGQEANFPVFGNSLHARLHRRRRETYRRRQ